MLRIRPFSAALSCVLTLAALTSWASAQGGGSAADKPPFRVKEPVRRRVYQRDRTGRAEIPLVIDGEGKESEIREAALYRITVTGDRELPEGISISVADGKISGVPTGGPYALVIHSKTGTFATVEPFFVGDLWVLAGQSNMEGVGNLIDVTPPHPKVMSLGMDDKWDVAKEPLHWLIDSPDPVHSGNPDDRVQRSEQVHKTRTKGAGLGLPFASEMVEATDVPIGLIPVAHGGTRMDQWDPSKKGEGGNSLYGSMFRTLKLAGGKVKGVLWYQGESDADPERSSAYPQVFNDFITAVRTDLGQPDLPFYLVQIGRVVRGGDPKGWNAVQEAQRKVPDQLPNTAVISVIDLELDDLIHIGTQGLKRAGTRLARIALHELFRRPTGTTPTFERAWRGPDNTLVLKFKGVNAPDPDGDADDYGLSPTEHIAGFSIRKEDGTEIPLIYEAAVGESPDTVVLKLTGKIPDGARLWYGWGFDPFCNLTDGVDMAVPVFGPVALDAVK